MKKKDIYDFIINNKFLLRTSRRALWLYRGVINLGPIIKSKSYYPEFERKTKASMFLDNLVWLLKYGEGNDFYNLYGFDIKDSSITPEEYIDYLHFYNPYL